MISGTVDAIFRKVGTIVTRELPLPSFLKGATTQHRDTQPIHWNPLIWKAGLPAYSGVFDRIQESNPGGGITRASIHAMRGGPPKDLLVATMAWGFGPRGYGPTRTNWMLQQRRVTDRLTKILEAVARNRLDGFDALHRPETSVRYMKTAMGTKLLYFSQYNSVEGDALVLDDNVLCAMATIKGSPLPFWVQSTRSENYGDYLRIAHAWGQRIGQPSDVIEWGLFTEGLRLKGANKDPRR